MVGQMTKSLSSGWAVWAVTVGFVACGGTSTLRRGAPTGAGDDDDTVVGSGGSGATAGSAGKGGSGGTGFGQGGTSVGVGGTVGKGGTTGKGGATGKGGTTGKGGAAGKAGSVAVGGTAGTAGEAGGLNVDPGCTCTDSGARNVNCSTATVKVPSVFQDPAACTGLDTRSKRTYCDDGSAHYTFVEGEENEYLLEVDHSGNATYFYASGYISPGCGLDANDFDTATVTQGAPRDATCFESCALCGSYENLPACEACERAPNDPDTALETLTQFCTHFSCPISFADRSALEGACGSVAPPEVSFGCGTIQVSFVAGFSERLFVFDESNGQLIGARATDDVPSYPCQTSSYIAGTIPDGPCSAVQTCTLCTAGEAGAGGAPGAAGAGDGSACPGR